MASSSKYYWLKLSKDFFKRHDITVIEDMKNGKDYVLFYLKLLVESLSHEGNLRFSDTIPYNEEMLASVTRTNIDIVRSAIKIFTELHMMEMLDDGTVFMSEVQYMIGSETEWAEKKRIYREGLRTIEGQKKTMSDKSKSLEKEKEIDKELDKEKDITLPKHKHGTYSHVLLTDEEYTRLQNDFPDYKERIQNLDDYIEMKGAKYKNHNLTIRKWASKDKPKHGTLDDEIKDDIARLRAKGLIP